jgi:hypothetical protein
MRYVFQLIVHIIYLGSLNRQIVQSEASHLSFVLLRLFWCYVNGLHESYVPCWNLISHFVYRNTMACILGLIQHV